MIIEITNLDIHTAERVVDALEEADYSVELGKQVNQLYSVLFTSVHDRRYNRKAKLRYSCSKAEGLFIEGVVHGVKVTRQHYKGVGVMNTFAYPRQSGMAYPEGAR